MPRPPAIAIAVLTAFAAVGCTATRGSVETHRVAVAGPIAIDVESFAGDVIVRADPGITEPTVPLVREAIHGRGRVTEGRASLDAITVDVQLASDSHGPVLRVRATTTHPEPHFQRAHLAIDLPAIDGVRIAARHGRLTVLDARGPVSIVHEDGDVRFLTSSAIDSNVDVSNEGGDVIVRSGPGTRGLFDSRAAFGRVFHRFLFGRVVVHQARDDLQRATVDGGDNRITLRTVDGDVLVAVVANPHAIGAFVGR